MNTHLGRYDRPRRQAAEACLAIRKTLVVRNIARTVVALHESCDASHMGCHEKPESKDQEQSSTHEELYLTRVNAKRQLCKYPLALRQAG